MAGVNLIGDLTGAMKFMAGFGPAKNAAIHKEIAAQLESSTVKRFEDEVDPEGNKWKESLRANLEGGQTLTDKGQLKSSITSKHSDAYAGVGINKISGVGTNKFYGAIHQFGGKAGKNKSVELPARPYIGVSKTDEKEHKEILKRHLLP